MYLSNSKRFLFIAIPKTGCSSILYALSSDNTINDKSSTHVWNFKYPEIYHSTLENTLDNINKVEHLGFNVLDESFFNYDNFEDDYVKFENKIQSEIVKKSYYKAVFVRNPWDRFISGYLFIFSWPIVKIVRVIIRKFYFVNDSTSQDIEKTN